MGGGDGHELNLAGEVNGMESKQACFSVGFLLSLFSLGRLANSSRENGPGYHERFFFPLQLSLFLFCRHPRRRLLLAIQSSEINKGGTLARNPVSVLCAHIYVYIFFYIGCKNYSVVLCIPSKVTKYFRLRSL